MSEHDFKLYGKVLDDRLRDVVDIDKIQYRFMPRRGTIDTVFVLRRLDRVLQEVICFGLRQKAVPKYLVNGVMSLYKGCKTSVAVDGELSSSFPGKVGVHQESALSPFLFVMVMDVLVEDLTDGSLM